MTAVSALLTSVLTSFVIFLIIYAIYLMLAKKAGNAVVFFPSRILSGRGIPDLSKWGTFQWIRELSAVTDKELPEICGLDAAIYVYFQKTCLFIILWATVFCLPIIVAVSRTDDYYSTYNADQTDPDNKLTFTDFDLLAMGNIKPESHRLWVGAIGGWWVTIGTLYFLYHAYLQVVELRTHFYNSSPKALPEQYCALVRDIPKQEEASGKETDGGSVAGRVDSFFSRIYGDVFLGSSVVAAMGKVSAHYKKFLQLKQKLSRAEGVLEASKTEDEPQGKRPQHKTGPLGLCGNKVDSIERYREEIQEMTPVLEEAQREANAAGGGAALVYFKNRQLAAAAQQSLHAETAGNWLVVAAPEPRDVEWGNLQMGRKQRLVRSLLIYGLVFLTVCFFMVPITLISSFSTLDNLRKTLPFLKVIVDIPSLKAILQAFLPQLALIIFLAILPPLLTFLSRLEGLPAKSHIVRAASGKYFYFIVFNVFLGVTLAGSLFSSLEQVINQPSSIVDTLGSSLPQQSTFFITFVAIKIFISQALELSRVVPLLLFWLKKKYLCKTDHELLQAWAPGQVNYVSFLPNDLLIITITLAYAVIAPVILPFGALYFVIRWAVMRHQVINVYVPEWESQGRMWPHMHNRALAALGISQLTMIGFFAIKKFPYAVILLPLPVVTLLYYRAVQGRFYRSFQVQSLDVASRDSGQAPPTLEALSEVYCMEYLQEAEVIGKEFFEGEEALAGGKGGQREV